MCLLSIKYSWLLNGTLSALFDCIGYSFFTVSACSAVHSISCLYRHLRCLRCMIVQDVTIYRTSDTDGHEFDVPNKKLFLLAFHSNYGAILHRFRDITTYWSKIAKFLYFTCLCALTGGKLVRNSRRCSIFIELEWLGYRVVKKLTIR